jgi:hypothetical protein
LRFDLTPSHPARFLHNAAQRDRAIRQFRRRTMVHLHAPDALYSVPVTTALEDDARWRAMTDRVTTDTGPFVIAVSTTGIYCRVGCPARQPLRKNVLFFDSVEEARSAGFRACKRCHPDDQPDLHAT